MALLGPVILLLVYLLPSSRFLVSCQKLAATPEETAELQRLIDTLRQLNQTGALSSSNQEQLAQVVASVLQNSFISRGITNLGLADTQNQFGYTMLTLAAAQGLVSVVKTMLDLGAYVDLVDENGWTALVHAARNNRSEVGKLLLSRGASVNHLTTDWGNTALTWAAYNGDVVMVQDLLAAGADVNVANRLGNAPLILAAMALGRDPEGVTRLLLLRRADPNVRNLENETAAFHSAKNKKSEVLWQLLEAGADPDIKDRSFGDTALAWASVLGHEEEVRKLLAARADPNLANNNGISPLQHAARGGRPGVARLLLTAGALVDHRSADGDTPLMEAVFHSFPSVVEELLRHCPDLLLYNNNRKTVAIIIREKSDNVLQQMIEEHQTRVCVVGRQAYQRGSERYNDCSQVRCCHGIWTPTGVTLPNCRHSCRTPGCLAGVCSLIDNCPNLRQQFISQGVNQDPQALSTFVGLYGCGFQSDENLRVCCSIT